MEKEEDMPELKNTRKLLYYHSKRALATEESYKIEKGYKILRLKSQYNNINKHNCLFTTHHSPFSSKRAFTLAEVLITLGIIGVVAAMTIPTLMQKYQVKRTVALLKEDQAIISQMLKLAIEENGEPEGWLGLEGHGTESAKVLAEKLNPHWKLALDCGVDDENGDCVYNGEYKYLNGTPYMNYAKGETLYKVKLNNGTGITYYFYPNPFRIFFVVDVNGDKKPNVVGRDVFWFWYQTDKGLRPLGAPNEYYDYRTDCQLNNKGVGCAYYVLTFGNQDYLNK